MYKVNKRLKCMKTFIIRIESVPQKIKLKKDRVCGGVYVRERARINLYLQCGYNWIEMEAF